MDSEPETAGYHTMSFRPKSIRPAIAALMVMMALSACSSGEDGAISTTTSQPGPPTSLHPTTTTTTTVPVDVQTSIDWFVTILNGEELTEAEYEERFADSFRAQVPYADGMIPVLDQLRPAGPYTVLARDGDPTRGEAVIESADGTRVQLSAEVDAAGQLTALLVQPADTPTLDDPPADVAEAFQRLATIGDTRAMTAEIVDGRCTPVDVMHSDQSAPLGSVFKLYVLTALGEAVASGEISWDDDLTIRDELKSIASGMLQDRDDGEVVTVEEAATLMISISDNTATDHLIDLLGRKRVEAVMSDYVNTNPETNVPLLTTRELTALKIGPASGLRVQWIEGDESERRAILAQISDITPDDLPVRDWLEPIDPDLVEWFASPADLCRLAIGLTRLDDADSTIGEILSVNPGVPADPGIWQSIWFKGGSEPGLVSMWFVTRSGERTFFTFGSVVDPVDPIDQDETILLMAAARDLLAP